MGLFNGERIRGGESGEEVKRGISERDKRGGGGGVFGILELKFGECKKEGEGREDLVDQNMRRAIVDRR